jgi:Fe-Mn family superoxide dismutase
VKEFDMTRFPLKPLPYPADALTPVMSPRTVQTHHGKHQAGYVTKLNTLVRNSEYDHDNLESLIVHTRCATNERAIFNNAAQLWNHEFFWDSLSPNSSADPPAHITERLVQAFGSVEFFREEVVRSGVSHFGSGWVWLTVSTRGRLSVVSTHDADSPLLWGAHPLWVCDLWEHAYYLDWQQDRAGFVRAVVERLINWKQVTMRLADLRERHAA